MPMRSGAMCHSAARDAHRADRALRVAELDRMVILRAEPVAQHERGDAERVEVVGRRAPFVVHRQPRVAAAGRDDHRGHRAGGVRRHVDGERRLVAILVALRAGRAVGPQQDASAAPASAAARARAAAEPPGRATQPRQGARRWSWRAYYYLMRRLLLTAIGLTACLPALGVMGSEPSLTLEIKDYVELPITGKLDGTGQTRRHAGARELAARGAGRRESVVRQRPQRPAVHPRQGDEEAHDLSRLQRPRGSHRPLPQVRRTRPATPTASSACSSIPTTGATARFYTVHIEDPAIAGFAGARQRERARPRTSRGYEPTPADRDARRRSQREGVLIEWTDTNTSNTTFEGTARELMRVQLNTRIHPMGDLDLQPGGAARRRRLARALHRHAATAARASRRTGHPHRTRSVSTRWSARSCASFPISTAHASTSVVSDNGRYRIPNDNPFVVDSRARARRSGPTASAIRIGCTWRSIRPTRGTTG